MASSQALLSSEGHGRWAGVEEGLGFVGATISLAVSMLGTGIVAFPYTFALCGYIVGPASLIFAGILAHLSYVSLIRCTARVCVASYGGLLQAIPKAWGHYTNVTLWLLLILATTAYVLIAADIIRGIVLARVDEEPCALHNSVLFAMILSFTFPLCLLRSFRGLAAVSMYCSCAILAAVCLIVWEAYGIYATSPPTGRVAATPSADPRSVTLAVPLLGCAMFGHMNMPHIYAELQPKAKPLASLVALTACAAVVGLYMAVGCMGYAAFGGAAAADVVAQIAARAGESGTVVVIQGLLASFVVLKTPLLILPLRSLSLAIMDPAAVPADLRTREHVGLTAALLACVYTAAVALPDLGELLEILGAVCVIPLSFVVPARLSWAVEVPRPAARCLLMGGVGGLASALSLAAIITK